MLLWKKELSHISTAYFLLVQLSGKRSNPCFFEFCNMTFAHTSHINKIHWYFDPRWMYRKAGQDKLIPVPRGMEFPVLMGGWQKCECLINLSIEELHNSIRKLKLGPCRKLPSMNLQGTLSSTIDQLTALTYLWVLHCLVWEELNVANNKSSVPG